MTLLRRIMAVIGIIGTLLAAEGLSRFGSFVGALGGSDTLFYQLFLLVSLIAAGVLLLAVFGVVNPVIKWLTIALTIVSILMLLPAPALPVVMQAISGLVVAALALIFVRRRPKQPDSANIRG